MMEISARSATGDNPFNPMSSPKRFSALTDVPVLLGFMMTYLLQGILTIQVFMYYRSFRRTDPRWLQITVFLCLFVECLSTALATMFAIKSIIQLGPLALCGELLGFRSIAVLCGLASSLVHASYSWRIHILGGSWIVIGAVMVLSFVQCVMVSISGFGDFNTGNVESNSFVLFSGVEVEPSPVTFISGSLSIDVLWLAGSAICDIIIASTLLYLLNYWHSRDHLATTGLATRVERVIAIAVDTGMITAISASIELLVYLVLRDTLIPLILFFALPKLYANSLMATLNARSTLTIPVRKSREDGHTRKKFSFLGRIRNFKDVISRLFGIKQADTSLPTSGIAISGGTRKNFLFSERIRKGKDIILRRFGMKRTDTTLPTSGIEIEIDIRQTTSRSSVLDIRRYSLESIIDSEYSLEENSIVGSR